MAKTTSFHSQDRVEIIELVNKATGEPIATFFYVNRKFFRAYSFKMKNETEIAFKGEYVACPNAWVAAGYELCCKQHGKLWPYNDIPGQLRLALINSLPEGQPSCSPSTPLVDGPIPTVTMPSKTLPTTEISAVAEQVTDHSLTEKD